MSESRASLNLIDLPEDVFNSIVETMGKTSLGRLVQTCRFFKNHPVVNEKLTIELLNDLLVENLCVKGEQDLNTALLILKTPILCQQILTLQDPDIALNQRDLMTIGDFPPFSMTPPPVRSYLYRLAVAHTQVAQLILSDESLAKNLLDGEMPKLEEGLDNPAKRMRY